MYSICYTRDLLIHETFPYFCYRNMFSSSNKRAANSKFEVSTLLFGYSRRLRHQEKLPNGRWRCESPFGTLWTENLQTEGKNSSKRCAMVSAPSQSLLRTGALQNFPGGPGGCRLKHYSCNIQIISKNYNLFFDFKSPKKPESKP